MSGFYGPQGGSGIDLRVRRESDPPANPAPYATNIGVIKLTESMHAPTLKQLKDALAAK